MLDAIIGPDGKKIDLKSIVKDTPTANLLPFLTPVRGIFVAIAQAA